jgi:hypothetical protein
METFHDLASCFDLVVDPLDTKEECGEADENQNGDVLEPRFFEKSHLFLTFLACVNPDIKISGNIS